MLNEVIRTSGDVRRLIAETMSGIRSGDVSVEKGAVIAQLAKELTSSMQVEVNIAKVRIQLLDSGVEISKAQHMGQLLIGDEGTPTLSGKNA